LQATTARRQSASAISFFCIVQSYRTVVRSAIA
jgi:hypothetical protein